MMLLGFAGLGFAGWRRAKRPAPRAPEPSVAGEGAFKATRPTLLGSLRRERQAPGGLRRAASRAFHLAQASTASARQRRGSCARIALASASMYVDPSFVSACIGAKPMLTTAPRAYGVADPAELRVMSGREFLQAIIDGRLPAPPIARTMSFRLVEVGDGFAAFEGDAGPHLLNPLGIVHGGWGLTLIDSAAGCAAHTLVRRARATRPSRPRPISPGPSPRIRALCAPKGAWWAAGDASSPARRKSSTPRAASLRMGPRPSWSSPQRTTGDPGSRQGASSSRSRPGLNRLLPPPPEELE